MLEDLDEDTHLCIKCSRTIVGLENYVRHRKSQCSKSVSSAASLNHEIIGTNHSYRSFEFTEPPSVKHDKQFNFNYEIESVHPDHEDSHDDVVSNTGILPSPMHQSEKVTSDYKTDPNKSLSESYDYNYGLGADVFFSLLNLQSSSKTKTQTVPTNVSSGGASLTKTTDKMLDSKPTDSGLVHTDHMDDWINTGASTSGTDKLMKAVNAISGTKKPVYDSPHYSYEYTHGSPEHTYDDDDDEILGDLDDVPPHTHTGGKWKPSESNHRSLNTVSRWYERWDISEENNQLQIPSGSGSGSHDELIENQDEYNPPPSHTKGKWVPGTKILQLDYKHKERHDSESFSEQFWCRSCNRKLSSRIVYERHLKSKLHTKRSQPENELEQVSLPFPRIEEIVSKKYTANSDDQTKRKRKDEISYIKEHPFSTVKKRNRRFNYIKCGICKTRFRTFIYGKHLISHYHYRRMYKNPTESYATILDNIHRIVLQSPYQCQPCRFYANTEEMFLRHWDSDEHLMGIKKSDGKFWCEFCKFTCNTNDEMRFHLMARDHQEVVMAINRSVPIICRKKTLIQCDECMQEFSLNIELRKHANLCTGTKPLGTASDQYQRKFYCSTCNEYFQSIVSYQRHATIAHSTKSYFCGPCELSFTELDAAKRHRVSAEHKVKAARIKAKNTLKRKCIVCGEMQGDLLLLKEHLRLVHPEHSYSCYFCGQNFILSQELSRHIRDKVCKNINKNSSEEIVCHENENLNTMSLLELPIITDISEDVEVAKFIVASQTNSTTSMDVASESLVQESFMIIDNDALSLDDDVQSKSVDGPSSEAEHPILWGCKQCDFRTATEAECIFHEMLHKWNSCNDKMPCPICNRVFGKSSLRCHLRLHTNERIFKCDQCELKFTRKANLKEHTQRIHLKRIISKKQPSKTNRIKPKSSALLQNNEELFGCTICEKRFQKKSLLEQHMHCHREIVSVKVFECLEKNCLFTGRSAAELRVHQSTHSNEKNFYCTIENCSYQTKTNALLNRHIKSQHQEGSNYFQCPHCDFSTKISSHLKRHSRIHTGEKPYKCPHCDYVSNNPENLRKHVINTNKHLGRYLYECKFCIESNELQPFASNNTKDYKCHLVSVHNQKK